MSANKRFTALVLVCATAFGGFAGCGGSRNSSDPDDPVDFSLGTGDVNAAWTSSSTELIHNLSSGALYYLDVENQDVVAMDVASGDDSLLLPQTLFFGPSKMRLTANDEELYILESEDSANDTDGFPDIVRYNIDGGFINSNVIELNTDLRVDDFVASNDAQVVVASYQATTPSAVYLSLFNANGGGLLDEAAFDSTGFVVQRLALAADQETLLSSLVRNTGSVLSAVSIASGAVDVTDSENLTLAQTAINTFEPEGDRIFRDNGTVLDGNAEKTLGSSYESIDFDQDGNRVVILVDGSSGFIVRYFDLESLDLLGEQTLPTIADAAGMEPVKLFVDAGELYVVYREVTSAATKDYLLVEFDYPR
jgi:hypothetical protein